MNYEAFHDPADMARASYESHPVDSLEPMAEGDILDLLEPEPEKLSQEILAGFAQVLVEISGDGEHLAPVAVGERVLRVLAVIDPDFSVPPCEPKNEREAGWRESLRHAQPLRVVWAWLADGASVASYAELGMRGLVLVWVFRPDLLDGATLEDLAKLEGTSRQALYTLAAGLRELLKKEARRNAGDEAQALPQVRGKKSETTKAKCAEAPRKRTLAFPSFAAVTGCLDALAFPPIPLEEGLN